MWQRRRVMNGFRLAPGFAQLQPICQRRNATSACEIYIQNEPNGSHVSNTNIMCASAWLPRCRRRLRVWTLLKPWCATCYRMSSGLHCQSSREHSGFLTEVASFTLHTGHFNRLHKSSYKTGLPPCASKEIVPASHFLFTQSEPHHRGAQVGLLQPQAQYSYTPTHLTTASIMCTSLKLNSASSPTERQRNVTWQNFPHKVNCILIDSRAAERLSAAHHAVRHAQKLKHVDNLRCCLQRAQYSTDNCLADGLRAVHARAAAALLRLRLRRLR